MTTEAQQAFLLALGDRLRALGALHDGDARSRALIANLPGAAVFVIDRELRYRLAAGAALRQLGLQPSDFVGRTLGEVTMARPGDTTASTMESNVRRALDGESFTHEIETHERIYLSKGTPLHDADGVVNEVLVVSYDVTEDRRRARHAAFAAAVHDQLAWGSSEQESLDLLVERLGTHLAVDWCNLLLVDTPGDEEVTITHGWSVRGSDRRHERFRFRDFLNEESARACRAGQTLVVHDTQTDLRASAEACAVLAMGAFVAVPALRAGSWAFLLCVVSTEPRRWSSDDVELLQDLADRIFLHLERARAEAAQREHARKYRAVFDTIDEAFQLGEIIVDETGHAVDYRLLEMNPAWGRLTGFDPQAAQGRTARELVPTADEEWLRTCARAGLGRETLRREQHIAQLDRWYDVHLVPFGAPESRQFLATASDITPRKVAEASLAAAASRDAYRVLLTDALRPLSDPREIEAEATRLLGQHLRAQRAAYFEVVGDEYVVERDYANGVPTLTGRYPVAGFGEWLIAAYRSGVTVVDHDVAANDQFSGEEHRSFASIQVASHVSAPVLLDGVFAAGLAVQSATPRTWTPDEVALIEETAQRTWATVAQARAEARLRESEARYRTLFESMDQGFCILQVAFEGDGRAVDYRFIEANPAFERQTGLVDAIGRSVRELVPDLEAHWFETYGRVALTGTPERFQNGSAPMGRWFDVVAFRVGAPEDRRVAVLFTDITARKRAEVEREELLGALGVERARLADVIRQAPAFIAVLRGPQYVVELVNDAFQELIGRRDVVGRPVFDALPEARGQGFEDVMNSVMSSGEPFEGYGLPVRLQRTPDAPAEERLIDLTYVALTETDGTRSGIMALGTDVTEQVTARREVERARDRAERLQALTAALSGARTLDDVASVIVVDMVKALGARTGALSMKAADGHALELLRTAGFPDSVLPGVARQALDLASPLTECFRTQSAIWLEQRGGPEGLDRRYPPIAAVWDRLGVNSAAFIPLVVAGESVGTISFAFADARQFSAESRAFLLALGQQAALAVERARLFDAERAARADAERANRSKSEFLAVMSHELRTPLNAIGGYAELLDLGIRGPVNEQQRTDLTRIQQSQRHLLGLINQVLNYSRIDAGAVSYDLAEVPVAEALAAAEALMLPQVRGRQLSYRSEPPPVTLAVRADREKLQQILLNLLSNAVKFTEVGGEIRMNCREHGDHIAIAVHDTGIGIDAEKLVTIFEPFVQVDQRLTRPHEGVGLGLAISRDLARGMGGNLVAESEAGRGSTFTLTLPRAEPRLDQVASATEAPRL